MGFKNGTIIDGKFKVVGLCSNTGGMGEILFVEDLSQKSDTKLVLKYCKEDNPNHIKRFKREVRIMQKFEGNSRIINIIYSNTEYFLPYFVMPYYKKGDLTNIIHELENNYEMQERILCSMIDCVQELHDQKIFHRDIKPQNFLIKDNDYIIVTDLGLGVEPDSKTRCTTTQIYGGTEGYLPPEFKDDGFKYADARGDIYMLGKSFYVLLTGQDPIHIDKTKLHAASYFIIEKACDLNKDKRYQNLMELKQAIGISYNVILGRGENIYNKTKQLLKEIVEKKETEKINDFIQNFFLLKEEEQIVICKDLSESFFIILLQDSTSKYLEKFLKIYQIMIERADYPFPFAENIAKNMYVIFSCGNTNDEIKSISLTIAIRAAYLTNRYTAMDICTSMICSVSNDTLGTYVSAVLINNNYNFIQDINLSDCKSDSVINAITVLKENKELANKQKLDKQNELNSVWGL